MFDENATARHYGSGRRPDSRAGEPNHGGTALSVPETDPELIAFNLWNEGRVDEAIQFLEREIAARRDRFDQEGQSGPPEAAHHLPEEIEPVSDWRKRHRTALAPADFNAFGAAVHTIDLVAKPADAILPHPHGHSLRRVWIMGVALAAVGISAAATLLSGRAGGPGEAALSAVEPAANHEQVAAVSATAPPPKPAQGMPAAAKDSNAIIIEADPDDVPVDADPGAAADAANADVPPPDDELAPDAAEDQTPEPATTASIDPTPGDNAASPIVVPRLPRQRPEPPAAQALAASPSAEPAEEHASADGDDLETLGPPPGYGPSRAPFFDPVNPRPTLTPAEYQVLLERRAWAENYVARRRAFAEHRAAEEAPILGDPGPFIRLPQD